MGEPRIRVSAILRWRGRILLARHEKAGGAVWLLPGGGVQPGESLVQALQRELWEETGLFPDGLDVPLEGPVAIVDSIAPEGTASRKHVVHVIFAAEVPGSLETWRHRTTRYGVTARSSCGSWTPCRSTRRSGGSCSAGSPAIRRSTSARCGPLTRSDGRQSRRRGGARAPPTRGTPAPRARPATAQVGGSPVAGVCERARQQPVGEPRVAREQRPCRYVPSAFPSRSPRPRRAVVPEAVDDAPERLGALVEQRRPAWFSKPASCRRVPARARTRAGRPDHADVAGDGLVREEPAPA
jgi:ADP-ribose pyrophosphatase YjhB (NUDIX family)